MNTPDLVLTFSVIEDDIDYGSPDDCSDCPVARAVNRALHGVRPYSGCHAEVDQHDISVFSVGRNGRLEYQAPTPPEVAAFIGAFDGYDDGPVEPFSATVTLKAVEY